MNTVRMLVDAELIRGTYDAVARVPVRAGELLAVEGVDDETLGCTWVRLVGEEGLFGLPDGTWKWVNPVCELANRLAALRDEPVPARTPPGGTYSTSEFGELVGRSAYTVRQLCVNGVIRAERDETAGRTGEWRIPATEFERWNQEGPFRLPRKGL